MIYMYHEIILLQHKAASFVGPEAVQVKGIVSDTSVGETGDISKETGLGQLWTRTME
jgi:hypothetical protein